MRRKKLTAADVICGAQVGSDECALRPGHKGDHASSDDLKFRERPPKPLKVYPLTADPAVAIARIARAMSMPSVDGIMVDRRGACWLVIVEKR